MNTYPIPALSGSEHGDLAAEFVAGDEGWAVLEAAGFAKP